MKKSPETFKPEFTSDFRIRFRHKGLEITRKISLNKIVIDIDTWFYYFDIPKLGAHFEVWGSVDEDGNVRTSGPVDSDGHCAAFAVNVYDLDSVKERDGQMLEQIDDVDVL